MTSKPAKAGFSLLQTAAKKSLFRYSSLQTVTLCYKLLHKCIKFPKIFEKWVENAPSWCIFAFCGRFSAIFEENCRVHRSGSVTVCYKPLHKACVQDLVGSAAGVQRSSQRGPSSAQQLQRGAEMRTTITLRAVRYALKVHVTVWVFA